ncbi:hypothetical protein HAX54_024544 [Datura stramonium]|uniref:Uncharacterized protein n=1 Tax=Datura stramonium TaxID=4076 RepID=A0ABS8S5H4_DATST|nr:hypothetical protein [Datura stramonium]
MSQFPIEEQTPFTSSYDNMPCGDFDPRDTRKKIPSDTDEFNDEGPRNDIDSGDVSLEKMLPYKPSATLALIPKRFRMADVSKYDGTTTPYEHVMMYTMAIKGNNLTLNEIKMVLIKKFSKTLIAGPFTWYLLLPEHWIDNFVMLAD